MKNNNKINNNNKMKIKNKMKNSNITKTLPEVLPSKVTSLGVFDFVILKK